MRDREDEEMCLEQFKRLNIFCEDRRDGTSTHSVGNSDLELRMDGDQMEGRQGRTYQCQGEGWRDCGIGQRLNDKRDTLPSTFN